MRNSDPDAAVYWLARMVEAGEDPLYIARRLVRFASEDVGNADPQALTVAVAAKDAVHFIGMPEGNTALAQAAIYLATAPKSNAVYEAYNRAADDAHSDVARAGAAAPAQRADEADEGARLREGLPLRPRRGRRRRRHVVPAARRSQGRQYYEPTERGFEKEIKRRLDGWDRDQEAAPNDRVNSASIAARPFALDRPGAGAGEVRVRDQRPVRVSRSRHFKPLHVNQLSCSWSNTCSGLLQSFANSAPHPVPPRTVPSSRTVPMT